MYLPRTVEKRIRDVSAHFPVVLLTGARQTGKTTLLKRLAGGDRQYVTLDDHRSLDLARNDPALFLQRHPGPLLIDEIQRAPQLLPRVKMAVDENRRPGRFWLIGSQKFHLMRNVTESLAGRVAVLPLLGLSRHELAGRGADCRLFTPDQAVFMRPYGDPLSLGELFRLVWLGSFPALAAHEGLNRDEFMSGYVDTYIKRDARDLSQVGDESAFARFLAACASRTGQLLNVADLSRDADVSPATGKHWLSILETSGLIFRLEPYFINAAKRMIKAPKLYFLDTGLAAYLAGYDSPIILERGAASGAFFETWVMAEMLKNWLGNVPRAPFYFYRDKDKVEIDLLIIRNGTIYPLEIKKTASPDKNDVRHFRALEKLGLPIGPGGVICLASEAIPLTEQFWSVPAALI